MDGTAGKVINTILFLSFIGFLLYKGWHSSPTLPAATMASAIDARMAPVHETRVFMTGDAIHCCVRVANLAAGKSAVLVRWFLGGTEIYLSNVVAEADVPSGWMDFHPEGGTLKPGSYKTEVRLNGDLKYTLDFNVIAR